MSDNKAYSKRELDQKFKSSDEKNDAWSATIMEKLEDMDKYKLTPMLEQAKLTNGRVSSLERWRTYLTGGAAVVMTLMLPILGWALWKLVNLNDIVDEQFSKYEITGQINIK